MKNSVDWKGFFLLSYLNAFINFLFFGILVSIFGIDNAIFDFPGFQIAIQSIHEIDFTFTFLQLIRSLFEHLFKFMILVLIDLYISGGFFIIFLQFSDLLLFTLDL